MRCLASPALAGLAGCLALTGAAPVRAQDARALRQPAAAPAPSNEPVPTAAQVLADMKAATGGAAWDTVRTLHQTARISTGGLGGPFEEWDDVSTGRFAVGYALGPAKDLTGFDGAKLWNQDPSGHSRYVTGTDDLQGAVSSAYRTALAYWFTDRRQGAVTYLRRATEGERRFDVLQASPAGGRPFEIWVDADTHRIDRTVELAAEDMSTTFYSDYRTVNGIALPFASRQTNGQTQYDVTITVQSVAVNEAIPASRFALPAPPLPDFTIQGGAAAVTVPFEYRGDHIYFPMKINGRPLSAVLDTGGVYVVTPELARSLGLKTAGSLGASGGGDATVKMSLARVDSVQIGGLTLNRPLFYVIPIPMLTNNPITGFELFQRFVVQIDYDKRLLTFTRPDRFTPPAKAIMVPFRFNGRTPEVDGAIDGVKGVFTIDTGSGGSVDLAEPFVERNSLKAKYKPKITTISGWGVGGPITASITRARTLTLGGATVHGPLTTLQTGTGGIAADSVVAGNIGEGILHRFNLTFDYAHQRIYFVPNGHYKDPDPGSRTGLVLDPRGAEAVVYDVVAGSPAAAAGIQKGDVLVAIDGKKLPPRPFNQLRSVGKRPSGTKVRLQVRTKEGKARDVTVVLRDLI